MRSTITLNCRYSQVCQYTLLSFFLKLFAHSDITAYILSIEMKLSVTHRLMSETRANGRQFPQVPSMSVRYVVAPQSDIMKSNVRPVNVIGFAYATRLNNVNLSQYTQIIQKYEHAI